MPLAKRIIPCLDVDHGKVVKGVNFVNLQSAGNPVDLARQYSNQGADELVFLDITASSEKRDLLKEVVERVAKAVRIPFTVGGGIRNVPDARLILCSGADKVSVNTAAIENPRLITDLAEVFGQQCVVVAIDAKRRKPENLATSCVETDEGPVWFEVTTYGGRKPTGINAIEWAKQAANLGAGEFLLTSMDKDGTKDGYDLDLTKIISESVRVPVIASGGAGKPEHFLEVFSIGKADAALAASVFHYNNYPVPVVKQFLQNQGVNVRP
jgi:cyclase